MAGVVSEVGEDVRGWPVGDAAWQAPFEHAGVTAGQSVLIDGGGGAVGGYAVQLAKQEGATVTTSAAPRSHDRLRSYGADRIVDYTAGPLAQAVAGQHSPGHGRPAPSPSGAGTWSRRRRLRALPEARRRRGLRDGAVVVAHQRGQGRGQQPYRRHTCDTA